MSNLQSLEAKSQQLQNNLIATLGQIALLEEQRRVIREELAKVQGRIEELNESKQKEVEP